MFTTDKTEAELRHAFGKQTIEDVESVVFLSLRALTMHADNICGIACCSRDGADRTNTVFATDKIRLW